MVGVWRFAGSEEYAFVPPHEAQTGALREPRSRLESVGRYEEPATKRLKLVSAPRLVTRLSVASCR